MIELSFNDLVSSIEEARSYASYVSDTYDSCEDVEGSLYTEFHGDRAESDENKYKSRRYLGMCYQGL